MNEYIDFWKITEGALEYAMEVLKIENKKLKKKIIRFIFKIRSLSRSRKHTNKIKRKRVSNRNFIEWK